MVSREESVAIFLPLSCEGIPGWVTELFEVGNQSVGVTSCNVSHLEAKGSF